MSLICPKCGLAIAGKQSQLDMHIDSKRCVAEQTINRLSKENPEMTVERN